MSRFDGIGDCLLAGLEPLRRHWAVLHAAWGNEVRRPRLAARTADELAFLPAVIEIVETPASPAGRATSIAIMALVVAALAWATLGRVDIHATAQGRIIPGGKDKLVAPPETASVASILVKDGDRVTAGQVLVELDPAGPQADATQYHGEWLEQVATAATLRALLAGQDKLDVNPLINMPPALLAVHQAALLHKLEDSRSTVMALRHEQEQKEAEAKGAETQIERFIQVIPVLADRARAKQEAADGGYGSRDESLSIKQELIESRHQLEAAHFTLRDDLAAIANVQERIKQSVAKFRADTLTQLADADQKIASLAQQMAKADDRARLFKLTAPVDGVVQQLSVHAPGAVVSQAQPLLMIVPNDEGIAVEASLQNGDAGFVRVGQDVEIKIEAFPFTRYGTIPGIVSVVSSDAVESAGGENGARGNSVAPGGTAGKGNPSDAQGPVYQVRIRPERDRIRADDGRDVALTPGMAVTAEIKTGKRRVISYVLDPVARYWGESLRER